MLISGQKQPPEVFYKKAILRILAKFTSNIYKETPVLESHFSTSAGGGAFSKFEICTIGYCLVYYKKNITSKVEFNT